MIIIIRGRLLIFFDQQEASNIFDKKYSQQKNYQNTSLNKTNNFVH